MQRYFQQVDHSTEYRFIRLFRPLKHVITVLPCIFPWAIDIWMTGLETIGKGVDTVDERDLLIKATSSKFLSSC